MNGIGMDIHMRTKFTRQWSYISAAVLRIGHDTLEVMRGLHKNWHWTNKIPGNEMVNDIVLPETISGFPVNFRHINSKQREFTVELGNSERIVIKTWKDFVRVDIINGSSKNFGDSLGLMGTYHKGLKMSRDNTTVMEDANEFGQEWQVLPSEPKLFHKVEGVQSPIKCPLPDINKARRRLREAVITQEDAETACSRVNIQDRDACVFDVLAVNDKEVAGAY